MDAPDLLKALLGFVLGAVGSYLGLYWKIKKELEAQYDKELRTERLKHYQALWKLLQPLAKYARPAPVNAAVLRKLAADLRQWYFEQGGLYMSKATRDEYFGLQDMLQTQIDAARDADAGELLDRDFERLRKKGSRLRTAMTVDVGSRRDPLLGDEPSA